MQRKEKSLTVTIMFVLAIAMLACPALADKALEELTQGETSLESIDEEQGVPISLERYRFRSFTNELKARDTRIIENFQEYLDFFQELRGPDINIDIEAAKKHAGQYIDFSRQVFIVVASQALDSCKRAGVKALERFSGGRIRVTMEESLKSPCQPKPLPEHRRYAVIGMPIERPVKKVELVHTSRTYEVPQLPTK